MAYTGLPNGNITWAANELVTSAKMNLFSQNQADIAQYLMNFDPNDGTLTIKVNGTTKGTFTADDVNNVTVDIPVPTTVAELSDEANYARANAIPTALSQLTNDENFVKAADIATVNNGTLTVKRNGTTLGSFGANSATNQDIDITVPDDISDLTGIENYYTKTQADAAIATAIGNISAATLSYEIVTNLPTVNIDPHTVYLHKEGTNTYYDQWMYIGGSWAHLGSTEVDMTQYATVAQVNAIPIANDPIIRITEHDGTLVDSFSLNQSTNQTIALPNPAGSMDTTVTAGSSNAPTSDAVYNFVKDSTVTLKDDDNATLGSFTVNQSTDTDVIIPAANGSRYGLVKIVTSTTDIGVGAALAEGTIYCVVGA